MLNEGGLRSTILCFPSSLSFLVLCWSSLQMGVLRHRRRLLRHRRLCGTGCQAGPCNPTPTTNNVSVASCRYHDRAEWDNRSGCCRKLNHNGDESMDYLVLSPLLCFFHFFVFHFCEKNGFFFFFVMGKNRFLVLLK